jgi:hypothetical protein
MAGNREMTAWSLHKVFETLHNDVEGRLRNTRETFGHPVAKGDATEGIWCQLFETYLPKRYKVAPATIVDAKGHFSDQIDLVVYDQQYSPFVLSYEGQNVLPSECVYAVFEAKQSIGAKEIAYAQTKAASVRKLHRTSLPIPSANGTIPAKPLHRIIAGVLSHASDWKPALGPSLADALTKCDELGWLDIGCIASKGHFVAKTDHRIEFIEGNRAAVGVIFELIAHLQECATVPMIDVRAYAKWL